MVSSLLKNNVMAHGQDLNDRVSTEFVCQDPKSTVADNFGRLVLYQWHRNRRQRSSSHGCLDILNHL